MPTRHEHVNMHPVMNNTKWDEVGAAMSKLEPHPKWRTRDRHSSHVSEWDADWYYHFRLDGYDSIEWVEIKPTNANQQSQILEILRHIGVPGRVVDTEITVYGYVVDGHSVDWL